MARRSNHIKLGCVACEDLSQLGAGKEGWLVDNPDLLCTLDSNYVALANRSIILILGWPESSEPPLKIRPEMSQVEAEYISAIEWLVFDDIRVIVAGTSSGYLLIYSLTGALIHRQLVYHGRILKLRVRGINKDLIQGTSTEEVYLVIPGVIARFDGSDIQTMLQRWFDEKHSQFWEPNPERNGSEDFGKLRIPYQIWNVGKYGTCADAAITGTMPPPLMEIQSSQRYYCAVAIGEDAVISAFRSGRCGLDHVFAPSNVPKVAKYCNPPTGLEHPIPPLTFLWKFSC